MTQRPTLGNDGYALCPGDAADVGGQRLHQQRLDRQLTAMTDSFDRLMLKEPLPAVAPWLPLAMDSAGITRLELLRRGENPFTTWRYRAIPTTGW